MKKVLFLLAITLCLSATAQKKVINSKTAYAREVLQPYVDRGELPGAISIFYNNGVQEICCVGYADVEKKRPIRLDNVYMQCSQTKGFCGVTIAKLVEEGEVVLDMFAGIGYFSIPIGVHSNAKHVYSIEINPNSYFYLCENIKLNKLDNITPILGDCMVHAPKYNADRIVMGYVKTTHHYLNAAINSLNEGGILHYHETVPEKLMDTRPLERIISQAGNREVELLKLNKIKKYAPGVEHVVLDVKIN